MVSLDESEFSNNINLKFWISKTSRIRFQEFPPSGNFQIMYYTPVTNNHLTPNKFQGLSWS